MGEFIDRVKEGLGNLVKKYGKKGIKKLLLILAKPLLIALLVMTLVASIVGIWSSVTDTLKGMLSQLSSYSKSVWKYLTDDYWFDIENKDIEREVRLSDGSTKKVNVSIVEAYLLDLEEKNISVKDLYLLGDGDSEVYYHTDTRKEKTVWELIEEDSENTRLMKKYVSEFIRAEFITNQMHRRRGNALVNVNDENKIDGGVYLYRTQKENEDGQVSKTDKNIYQMTYVEYEKFLEYYNATGTAYVENNVEKYYTVAKEDGQLGAIAYSEGDLMYYKVDTKQTTHKQYKQVTKTERRTDLTLQTEDYQSLIAEYTMPYEFLIALCQYTQNPEYVYHVARMARKTRIDLLVQDGLTTTDRVESTTGDVESSSTTGDNPASTSSLGNQEIERLETYEVVDTPHLIVSKVDTWSTALWNRYVNINHKTEEEREYSLSDRVIYEEHTTVGEQVTSSSAAASGSTTPVHIVHTAKGVKKVTTEEITINEFIQIPGVDKIRKSKQFLGLLRNETGEHANPDCFELKEFTQICVEEAVFDKEGKNVFYKIPNATREEAPYNNLQHAEEALCAQLQLTYAAVDEEETTNEYNEKLQGVEEYIRYVLRFPENEDVNLEEEEDWEDLIEDPEGLEGVGGIFDWDIDREEFIRMVTEFNPPQSAYEYKTYMVPYAGDFYDICKEYGVNPMFAFAHACLETGYGSSRDCIVNKNYFGYATPNGSSSGKHYASVADSIRDYCEWVIKNSTGKSAASNNSQAMVWSNYRKELEGTADSNIYVLYCRYAYLGDKHYCDEPDFDNPKGTNYYASNGSTWGRGGRIYIYEMYEKGALYTGQYKERCGHSNAEDPTTDSEKADYAVYTTNKRVQIANSIFGSVNLGTTGKGDAGGFEGIFGGDTTQGYTDTVRINGKEYKLYKQDLYPNVKYCSGTISSKGCSVTAVSIILSGYGIDINPSKLINGGQSSAISVAGKLRENGVSCSDKIYQDKESKMVNNLKNGKPVIIHVTSESSYTSNEHYLAILDISSDGKSVYVANPNGKGYTGWDKISNVLKGCDFIYTITN